MLSRWRASLPDPDELAQAGALNMDQIISKQPYLDWPQLQGVIDGQFSQGRGARSKYDELPADLDLDIPPEITQRSGELNVPLEAT